MRETRQEEENKFWCITSDMFGIVDNVIVVYFMEPEMTIYGKGGGVTENRPCCASILTGSYIYFVLACTL